MVSVKQQPDEGPVDGLPPLQQQGAILRTMTARRFGVSIRELAEEHAVSQKTIRRDLDTLRRPGFRLTQREEAHGRKRWIAENDPAVPPLSFDISELLALWVSRSMLQPLAGTLCWEAIQSALRKIRGTLKESSLGYVDSLAGTLPQTAISSMVLPCGSGCGSSSSPSSHSSIASRMFARASSRESPSEMHPGRAGTYTVNPPSSDGSKTTFKCMVRTLPEVAVRAMLYLT